MRKAYFVAVLAAALLCVSCDKKQGPATLKIAVIPKGTTHVYWKSVEAGARQAGKEFGVEIDWKGPMQESDRVGQIAV
ncbi:MAG TPA: hypothetical protein VFE47_17315, partial [Tepidisphaeraceae bacterium]|nr:hypothetical protein [Tepidisphaeraceae bacterium]